MGPTQDVTAVLSEIDCITAQQRVRITAQTVQRDDQWILLVVGGAGTYFLGSKHAKEWAAIAPIAPASFLMNNNRAKILQGIKDGGVPMLVVQGDADTAVPVANTRTWVETMKELKLNFDYKEIPGADHGTVITQGMLDIFAFLAKNTKTGRK